MKTIKELKQENLPHATCDSLGIKTNNEDQKISTMNIFNIM